MMQKKGSKSVRLQENTVSDVFEHLGNIDRPVTDVGTFEEKLKIYRK